MYKFYFNPDDGSFAQVYKKGGEITPEYAYQEINDLVGKTSDDYLPVCLATELFGREIVFPHNLPDKLIEKDWKFSDMKKKVSTVYDDMDALIHAVPWNRNLTSNLM